MYPWRIKFWMQKHSETSKVHPQFVFVVGKFFLHLSVISPSLFGWTKFFPSRCSSGQLKCSFEKSAENLLPENPFFFAQWTKRSGNFSFNWISHFLKLFFWTQKMKFWQPFRKNFDKSREIFDHDPKLKIKQFRRESFSICSFGHVECTFETFGEKTSTKKAKSLRWISK